MTLSTRRILLPIGLAALGLFVPGCTDTKAGDAGARPVEKPTPKQPAGHVERPQLVRSEPLPQLARDVLNQNMLRHGDNMESLLWATLTIDYETTKFLAESMLGSPKIARPPAGEDVLNSVFPESFFAYQDSLYTSLEQLKVAAIARDDKAIADSYGKLASSCVSCHALYLRPTKTE